MRLTFRNIDGDEASSGNEWLADLVVFAPALAVGIAFLALIVSIVGVLISISSRRLAGKSYLLAVRKDERQAAMLDLELVDALQTSNESGDRAYSLKIRVTNRSETAASIRTASLWVTYSKLGFVHRSEVTANASSSSPSFPVPSQLAARSTTSGHLEFNLPASRTTGWTILSYELVLLDTDSLALSLAGISINLRSDET